MKKFIFGFIALFTVILVSGCGPKQNTVRFNESGESSKEIITDENGEQMEEGEGDDEGVNEESEKSENEEKITEEEAENYNEDKEEVEEGEGDEVIETKEEIKPTGKLSVSSFENNLLKTNANYHVISGTAPSDTHRIEVNDYKLSKYVSGQTKWNYIAGTNFGTLKEGNNRFVVRTFDKSNKQTNSTTFVIEYEMPTPEELPDVGMNQWLNLLIVMMISGSYAIFRKYKWL